MGYERRCQFSQPQLEKRCRSIGVGNIDGVVAALDFCFQVIQRFHISGNPEKQINKDDETTQGSKLPKNAFNGHPIQSQHSIAL